MTKERLRQILLWFFFNPFWMVIAVMYWQSSVYMDEAVNEKDYLLKRIEIEERLFEANDRVFNEAMRRRAGNSSAGSPRDARMGTVLVPGR